MEPLHQLSAWGAKLRVYEDRIVIKRVEDLHLFMSDEISEKVIYIQDITSVQIKPAAFLRPGYIQFSMAGSATETHENTLSFSEGKNLIAKKIKATVERLKSNQASPGNPGSAADEIVKYKKLADDGVITQEEFEKKKRQLLGI